MNFKSWGKAFLLEYERCGCHNQMRMPKKKKTKTERINKK